MQVLPFSLLVLHISLMTCMNYSCICGCELKFLSLVETSKGFKQECLSVGILPASALWQQCPRWRSVMEELKLRVCCMDEKW